MEETSHLLNAIVICIAEEGNRIVAETLKTTTNHLMLGKQVKNKWCRKNGIERSNSVKG